MSDLSAGHRIESDPPTVRWVQRRIGRALLEGGRWLVRRKLWWLLLALGHASGHLVRWAMGH